MYRDTDSYREIREFLDTVPVIETHEHYTGIINAVDDVLSFLTGSYYESDILATDPGQEKALKEIRNTDLPFEKRYQLFNEVYQKSNQTAYARAMQIGLKECWNIEEISEDSLAELTTKFKDRDQKFYEKMMTQSGIKAKVANVGIDSFVNGESDDYTELCRFAFSLPEFHNLHKAEDIHQLDKYCQHKITCLDDYLAAFESFFKKSIEFGIVCCKDQTAYRRIIEYTNPAKADAEKVFNQIISHPRDVFGDNEVRVLDDWLFHYFMRLAAKYSIPVQIHTGHMAGIRNEIVKTNATHLTPLLELHSDVRFDLFHGNWPYLGEFLFLGKNYPNVWLDLCWVQSIDPLYSIELMKRAVMTVPHAKIMAFGGDTWAPEWAVGYLIMARDNVAYALSELVDAGWLEINTARQIAADWFFNNPNEFFNLGFEPYSVS